MTAITVSSGTSSGLIVTPSDTLTVISAGRTSATQVRGGTETVTSGGIVNDSVVSSGTEFVLTGGTASGTRVISSGGSTGGVQRITGGTAIGSDIEAGASVSVAAAGLLSAATIAYGGNAYVQSGGVATGTTVLGGLEVDRGGKASNTVLSGAASLFVSAGGSVSGLTMLGGSLASIDGTGAQATTVIANASVANGSFLSANVATLVSASVSDGGFIDVNSGTVTGTVVSSGGTEFLESGTVASNTVVLNGGAEFIGSGARGFNFVTSSGSVLSLDGTLTLSAGTATPIREDGTIDGAGTLIKTGLGLVILTGSNTFYGGTALSAGTLELTTLSAGGGGTISFSDNTTLRLDQAGTLANPLLSFTRADTIDLQALTFSTTYQVSTSGDTVTISNGGQAYVLTIDGASSANFQLAADGDGSVLVKSDVPCFAAGTRIATPDGDVAVEALRPGDTVRLAGGGTAAVQWTGQRRVACARHPLPERVWPVRIAAGAFGDGLPAADLRLSPDHAVYAEGVLIPAKLLVNGATIVQERPDWVQYHHIELAAHDVVLANGLPAETYLDTGNRTMFADVLHPDFARRSWEADGCAPLVTRGPVLAAVRARLLAEAARRGYRTGRDGALRVLAGDRTLAPFAQEGALLHFWLPAGTERVSLRSEAGIPWEHDSAAEDGRRLGAAVSRLAVSDGAVSRTIGLDDPALECGWHAAEGGLRWTDGDGRIALAGFGLRGPVLLSVAVQDVHPYWIGPQVETGAAEAGRLAA